MNVRACGIAGTSLPATSGKTCQYRTVPDSTVTANDQKKIEKSTLQTQLKYSRSAETLQVCNTVTGAPHHSIILDRVITDGQPLGRV